MLEPDFPTTKPSILKKKALASTTTVAFWYDNVNLLKPTGHVMRQQINIQQLYEGRTESHEQQFFVK